MNRIAGLALAGIACMAIPAAMRPLDARGASVARVGQPAPSFEVDSLDGNSLSSAFGGKPAFINVFASWCPPCRDEIPSIVKQSKAYAGRITFMFVDEQEAPSRVKAFANEVGMAPPVVGIDEGQFAATYGVGALPVSIFIDRNGVVQSIYRGPIPKDVLTAGLSKLAAR
jgi:cytochrome c biogenesis protein CcmG, thiol:disulfide interchange protein DsbE